jgi:hypothetical protein
MGVIKKPHHPMNTECVLGIVIDVCTKSFLLLSTQGNEKVVNCETSQEFMNVLEVVTSNLEPDQIKYADIAIYENVND